MAQKTLIVVGSPKSLTTWTAMLAARATGMINAGELFNLHHKNIFPVPFDHCDRSPAGERWISSHITALYMGHVIKDVVQPFHVSRFLKSHPWVNAVFIHRRREDVLACQRSAGFKPHEIADPAVYDELYRGLPRLDFEKLISDESHLHGLLRDLGYQAERVEYLTPEFREITAAVAASR